MFDRLTNVHTLYSHGYFKTMNNEFILLSFEIKYFICIIHILYNEVEINYKATWFILMQGSYRMLKKSQYFTLFVGQL